MVGGKEGLDELQHKINYLASELHFNLNFILNIFTL